MIDNISANGNEVTIKFTDVSEEDKQKLMEIAEKYSGKKNKRWKPENEDRYYYITGKGIINFCKWIDRKDSNYFNLRNCFKTLEEAEFELERRKVVAELQNYADDHNDEIDWNDSDLGKWMIIYNYQSERILLIDNYYSHYMNSIDFSSKNIAQKAIDTVGEDRIKKYIFGVSEDKVN